MPAAVRKSRICRPLAKFASSRDGGVAIIFSLSIMLLFATVGAAIDLAQVHRARTQYQNALDAGVIGGARVLQLGGSEANAIRAAQALLNGSTTPDLARGRVDFTLVDDGTTLQGFADMRVPTRFLAVLGINDLAFSTISRASFGIGSAVRTNVELVMMLDVTGSMRGQKIQDLKTAATELVDIIVSDDQSTATSKVGLAPFSSSIKLPDDLYLAATGRTRGTRGANSGCVVERTGGDAYTDATPRAGSFVTPLEERALPLFCTDTEVQPMTSDKSVLHRSIRDLHASGTTAGHLGTAWTWYLLSPNWSSALSGISRPAPYSELTERLPNGDKKLRKVAVLMTDGEFNTQFSGDDSTTQARRLCAEMKRTGIEVFTVGFDLGGSPSAVETLRGCASEPSNFYNTTTGEELRLAFRDIALRASPLRLTK